jgi:hypothetical protein
MRRANKATSEVSGTKQHSLRNPVDIVTFSLSLRCTSLGLISANPPAAARLLDDPEVPNTAQDGITVPSTRVNVNFNVSDYYLPMMIRLDGARRSTRMSIAFEYWRCWTRRAKVKTFVIDAAPAPKHANDRPDGGPKRSMERIPAKKKLATSAATKKKRECRERHHFASHILPVFDWQRLMSSSNSATLPKTFPLK